MLFTHLLTKAPLLQRYCNVYIHRESNSAIVASTYNHDGFIAEKPDGAMACVTSDLEVLGELIKVKFNDCEYKQEFNYYNSKKSDWPAYRKSGYKTIKAFENKFVRYSIRGANETNIIWLIESPVFNNEIRLQSAISGTASALEVGEWVIKFHKFFLKVEEIT